MIVSCNKQRKRESKKGQGGKEKYKTETGEIDEKKQNPLFTSKSA